MKIDKVLVNLQVISDIFCYLGHIPIGNKQNPKNLYYETFLSNFDKRLEKELRHFVVFKIFTMTLLVY